MIVPQKQYAVWQTRCDAFHEIISEENAEWVPHLVSFTDEIESDCPDSEVVGHARSARRQAVAFFNTKFGDRPSYIFNGFLASLLRLSIALGIHLIGYHGNPEQMDSSRALEAAKALARSEQDKEQR